MRRFKSMKNYNYEVNIDSALLNENLNFTQFLNNYAIENKGIEALKVNHPSAGATAQTAEYSIRYLKDKSTVDRIINAFMDMYKDKLHVTCISTEDLMVVRLY